MIPDLNLFVHQGANFKQLVTVYIDRRIKDLTGYSLVAKAARWYHSERPLSFSLNPSILDAASGKLTIELSDTETAALTEGRYVFSIFIVSSLGIKIRIARGKLIVSPSAI